jgi:hypothetical protein
MAVRVDTACSSPPPADAVLRSALSRDYAAAGESEQSTRVARRFVELDPLRPAEGPAVVEMDGSPIEYPMRAWRRSLQKQKPSNAAGFPSGETRTRTGDTTIFRTAGRTVARRETGRRALRSDRDVKSACALRDGG